MRPLPLRRGGLGRLPPVNNHRGGHARTGQPLHRHLHHHSDEGASTLPATGADTIGASHPIEHRPTLDPTTASPRAGRWSTRRDESEIGVHHEVKR